MLVLLADKVVWIQIHPALCDQLHARCNGHIQCHSGCLCDMASIVEGRRFAV